MSKLCTKCSDKKPLHCFSKLLTASDGVRAICKECTNKYNLLFRKSKKGLITNIYAHQRAHSSMRNHDMPEYTCAELHEWLLCNPVFNRLYDKWVESGYKKNQRPSCDRIDDYKSYTFDNVQVMTWQDNNIKGQKDRINGINNKASIPVVQMNLDGTFIKEWYSASQAERDTGIPQSNISQCIKGKYKTVGGYRWMRSIGIEIANNEVIHNAN